MSEQRMSSIPDWWTGPYPQVSSPQAANEYLDGRGGAISRRQEAGQWVLFTGPQELFRSPSPGELDAFLLGFTLGHSICERFGPLGSETFPAAPPEAAAPPGEVAEADVVIEAAEPADGGQEEGGVAPVIQLDRTDDQ